MSVLLSQEYAAPVSLLGRLQAALGRFAQPEPPADPPRDGDTLVQAFVAAAAHVIVADGEAAEAEYAVAVEGLRESPDLDGAAAARELEVALRAATSRARTRSGRIENLRCVAAVAGWPMPQRRAVFLLAADVADVEGTSGIEERALAEIAAALDVNRTALLDQRDAL